MLAALLLSGCAASSAGFKPILPSKDDKLTPGTKDQILEHNEFGKEQGLPAFQPDAVAEQKRQLNLIYRK